MTIETFIGTFILSCIGAYFVWRNNFKNRLAEAHSKFRNAFADAVLNLTDSDIPSAQVVNVFRVKHLAAIQVFRDSVPWLYRSGFDKATKHYRQCCDKCLETGIFAIANSESTEYAKENRKALLDSIHRLLKYAKSH